MGMAEISARVSARRVSVVWWLLGLNVAMSVTMGVAALVQLVRGDSLHPVYSLLAVSSQPVELLKHPWTLVTYMITQLSPLHLLLNGAWLWVFGGILTREKRISLLTIYFGAGVSAALAYLVVPTDGESYLLGASGAVLGFVGAAWISRPDHKIKLPLYGDVKLKVVALVATVLTLGGSITSPGSFFPHLCGLLFGVAYGYLNKKGRKRARITPRGCEKGVDEEEVNRILEKIRFSGYGSLSADERELIRETN